MGLKMSDVKEPEIADKSVCLGDLPVGRVAVIVRCWDANLIGHLVRKIEIDVLTTSGGVCSVTHFFDLTSINHNRLDVEVVSRQRSTHAVRVLGPDDDIVPGEHGGLVLKNPEPVAETREIELREAEDWSCGVFPNNPNPVPVLVDYKRGVVCFRSGYHVVIDAHETFRPYPPGTILTFEVE